MQDLKIAFFGVKSWERETVEKEIARMDAFGIGIFEEEVQDKIEEAAKYDIISTFIYSKMDEKVLEQLPKLKMVAARSTGVDHIDPKYCEKKKIKIVNVPEYGSRTVAEYTMALMLAVTKKITVAHQSVEDGEFSPEGLTGIDLYGKTLGVVGVGKIGSHVIKLARAMGMKVIATERTPDEKMAKRMGFKYGTLEEVIKVADVLTLHVPYLPTTFHLINKNNIKLMKKGSYLINTSRGPVVESEAVVYGLNKGILAGAGLDVTEEETMVENVSMVMREETKKDQLRDVLSFHMLRDRDDVVFTPHNAFNTKEAIERIVKTTVDNINKFTKENEKK